MTNHVEDTGLVTIGELKLVMMDKDEWRGRIHIRSKLALHQNEMNEGGSYPPKPNPYFILRQLKHIVTYICEIKYMSARTLKVMQYKVDCFR